MRRPFVLAALCVLAVLMPRTAAATCSGDLTASPRALVVTIGSYDVEPLWGIATAAQDGVLVGEALASRGVSVRTCHGSTAAELEAEFASLASQVASDGGATWVYVRGVGYDAEAGTVLLPADVERTAFCDTEAPQRGGTLLWSGLLEPIARLETPLAAVLDLVPASTAPCTGHERPAEIAQAPGPDGLYRLVGAGPVADPVSIWTTTRPGRSALEPSAGSVAGVFSRMVRCMEPGAPMFPLMLQQVRAERYLRAELDGQASPPETWGQAASRHLEAATPACTARERTYHDGILVTGGSAPADQWTAACESGNLYACAVLDLPVEEVLNLSDGLVERVSRYCQAGVVTACVALQGRATRGSTEEQSLERACHAGVAEACMFAAQAHLGPASSLPHTLELLGRGCELGHPYACYQAASLPGHSDEERARGFRHAAGHNVEGAAIQLAYYLEDGLIPGYDAELRTGLLERACQLGQADACLQFGLMYAHGNGLPRDRIRSYELYQQACTMGSVVACANAAVRLYDGDGVEQNLERAFELGVPSCLAGRGEGCAVVARMFWDGQLVEQDRRHAVRLFRDGCDVGHTASCSWLGYTSQRVEGATLDDYGRSVFGRTRACELGETVDCVNGVSALYLYFSRVRSEEEILSGLELGARLREVSIAACEANPEGADRHSCAAAIMAQTLSSRDWPLPESQEEIAVLVQSCDAGQATVCMYLTSLGADTSDPRTSQWLTAACDGEDDWACWRAGVRAYEWTEDDAVADLADALLNDRCIDHGYTLACHSLAREGYERFTMSSWASDDVLRLACDTDDWACAVLALRRWQGPNEEAARGAADALRTACESGHPQFCGPAIEHATQYRLDASEHLDEWVNLACEHGDEDICERARSAAELHRSGQPE